MLDYLNENPEHEAFVKRSQGMFQAKRIADENYEISTNRVRAFLTTFVGVLNPEERFAILCQATWACIARAKEPHFSWACRFLDEFVEVQLKNQHELGRFQEFPTVYPFTWTINLNYNLQRRMSPSKYETLKIILKD